MFQRDKFHVHDVRYTFELIGSDMPPLTGLG